MEQEQEKQTYICKMCGRKLKNPQSQEIGFGHVCYKKYLNKVVQPQLFIVECKHTEER